MKVSIFIKIILIIFCIIALVEVTSRVTLGNPPKKTEIIISDPVLNHKWKPNGFFVDDSRSIPYTIYTNSQSWLSSTDIQKDKPESTIRIFYIGDSTTQGVVAEEKKMTSIVEKELQKKFKKKGISIEVVNTGTSSWSPSIYYLEIKNHILNYSPDIVVISVDMTDVRDDSVYKELTTFDKEGLPVAISPSTAEDKASYRLAPQGLVKVDSLQQSSEKIRTFLLSHSSFYYHFQRFVQILKRNESIRKAFNKKSFDNIPPIDTSSWLSVTPSGAAKEHVAYSMTILEKTIELLKEKNVKVVVTSVPHYPQYVNIWSVEPHMIVEEHASKSGALYFNSYEALKPKITNSLVTDYYWDNDPTHFNEKGNALWAQEQVKFLLDSNNQLFE